jgi:hypothetical protein
MRNFIKQANLNVLNGTLAGTMQFLPGLNLIGGENGTLKTKLLQQLRGVAAVLNVPNAPLRIQSINPKRNSERRAVEQIWQQFRQQNRTLDVVLNERIAAQINDSGFENYPSLGDLYYLVFEHRTKDGADRRRHMQAVMDEFNTVIQSVFQQYALAADWDEATGAPKIRIRKGGTVEFPIEGLSLGEQEILGLVTSIHAARDRIDVYVIDEPEVHLNWHLEEKLFAFLDDLCEAHQKQAIVVTHSRAMFTSRYLPKAQFLYWEEGKIKWGPQLTPDQQRRIAGEAIEIIKLGNFSKPTFFVEDSAHARFLEALGRCLSTTVTITQCLNSPNVKSLFRLSEVEGGWPNTYFMVDGDNEGNPYPGSNRFIHLPVYCSDNFLLHPEHLATVFGKSVPEVQSLIRDAILQRRDHVLKQNKFFDFLVDQLQPQHITYDRLAKLDGSEIIDTVADKLGTTTSDLTNRMISHLHASGNLDSLLPKPLLDALHATTAFAATPTA